MGHCKHHATDITSPVAVMGLNGGQETKTSPQCDSHRLLSHLSCLSPSQVVEFESRDSPFLTETNKFIIIELKY